MSLEDVVMRPSFRPRQLRIYCAGPMARGVFADNMRMAMDAAHELIEKGHHPYVPHLCWYLELVHRKPAELWLGLDKIWLLQCEALVRLPGESIGADLEVGWAREHGLRVFFGTVEVPYVPIQDRAPLPEYRKLGGA